MKDYIKVVAKDKSVISKHNLSNFEKLLNPEKFVRVHKSYIVSINHVKAFSCSEIEIGRFNIPIGRTHKENALRRLGILSDSWFLAFSNLSYLKCYANFLVVSKDKFLWARKHICLCWVIRNVLVA